MEYRKVYAIKKANKERILKACPNCPNTSGIYFLLRKEGGFKYAYIGQAKHLLERIASHLSGYQRIDLSLRKHGLWSEDNKGGYKINYLEYPESLLDKMEKEYILRYANAGYQMRNATVGGQGQGKSGLDNARPNRGYYDGLRQGYLNARKEVAHLFNLHLDYTTKKKPPTKLQEKAAQKFKDFLGVENETN